MHRPMIFQPDRITRSTMKELAERLQQERIRAIQALHTHNYDPMHVQAFHDPLLQTAGAYVAVHACLCRHTPGTLTADAALATTKSLVADYCRILRETDHSHARIALGRQLAFIVEAQTRIASLVPAPSAVENALPAPPVTASTVKRIVVRSDWLHGVKALLFPVERMVVGAGRVQGNSIMLGAVFDVTGVGNPVHVEADRNKLFQARLAMEATGTHLAAWIHSHPGTGAGATHPSPIDTDQHSTWLHLDVPTLLSVIMVADDYLRFWGTAIEANQIDLVIEGPGVERLPVDGHIYRLTPAQ